MAQAKCVTNGASIKKELKRKEKDEANGDEPDENNPYQLGFEKL